MNTRSRMMLLALAVTLVSIQAAPALAQNDADIEIALQFTTDPGHPGRMLDMVYTEDGLLVVAFAELVPGAQSDRLVVAVRDTATGAWTLLSNSAYMFDHILELSLAVPGQILGDPSKDRVYIAVHFAADLGHPVEDEFVALVSGPVHTKWRGPGRVAYVSDLPQPASSWVSMHPTVAVVPLVHDDFTQHVVELVFMYPEIPGNTGGSIYRARSADYGHRLGPSIKLAGPGASGVRGRGTEVLAGRSYGHPSVVSDDLNAFVVIAFEDRDRDSVHVVSGPSAAHSLSYTFGTPEYDRRAERAPVLAAAHGAVNFTCLTDLYDPYGGSVMIWYHGLAWDTPSFRELAPLHDRAVSAGDIEVREGRAYITARCHLDNGKSGTAIVVFEGRRDDPGARLQAVPVNDHPSFTVQPRVAVTPDGFRHGLESYGYTTRDWTRTGGLDGGYVNIDL